MFDIKFGILKPSTGPPLLPPTISASPPPMRVTNFASSSGSSSWRVERLSGEKPLWYRTGTDSNGQIGTVLASPRLASLAGVESVLFIGDKFPLVRFDSRAGQFQNTYIDLGLKLEIRGFIIPGKRPRVQLLLTIESLQLSELVNARYPLTFTDRGEINVVLEDGEELLISGFSLGDSTKTEAIPLKCDLPTLGPLFRNSEASSRLVLTIRPYVMR